MKMTGKITYSREIRFFTYFPIKLPNRLGYCIVYGRLMGPSLKKSLTLAGEAGAEHIPGQTWVHYSDLYNDYHYIGSLGIALHIILPGFLGM